MKAQKKANLLNNEITQPSKYRTKNLVETDDNVCGIYNSNSQCKDYNAEVKSLWFQWCMHSCEGNDKDYRVTKISIIYGYKKDGYEKIYCIKFNKYRKFKNPKISYIFDKTLVLSFICNKCINDEKIFKEEKSIQIWKILGLVNNISE